VNEIEIKNAKIKSTKLGYDRGFLNCWLYLEYDCGGQGFGGNVFDEPVKIDGKFAYREGTKFGMMYIDEVMKTVGVESWEDLPGKIIRVKSEHSKIHAIGNCIEDTWFSPEELIKSIYGGE
jgi:hypothetical protein